MKLLSWKLIPCVSFSEISFDEPIANYVDDYELKKKEYLFPSDTEGDELYESKICDDLAVWSEFGKVSQVISHKHCFLGDIDLIGLKQNELQGILGTSADEISKPIQYDSGFVASEHGYFELNISLTIEHKAGGSKVVSGVGCTGPR